jgi:NAD(P)-dependent dehydrogenase (short-subunit alcohol dehydrogenase family)
MTAPTPTDRVVFIAGATGGLGRAAAAAFAEAGDRVVLGGTNADRLAAVASDLALTDDRWTAAVGDVSTSDGARAAAGAAIARFGKVDVLLHLVGGWAGGTLVVDLDLDEIRTMIDQHVWSTVHLAQAFVPGMVERGWGRVVAASSVAAITAPAKSGHYAAAKAAQETLLRSLAKEVAGSGVTVNVVAMRAIDEEHERETAPTSKNAPWTTPEEIAATILFLCSNEAAPINGDRIPLDGRA